MSKLWAMVAAFVWISSAHAEEGGAVPAKRWSMTEVAALRPGASAAEVLASFGLKKTASLPAQIEEPVSSRTHPPSVVQLEWDAEGRLVGLSAVPLPAPTIEEARDWVRADEPVMEVSEAIARVGDVHRMERVFRSRDLTREWRVSASGRISGYRLGRFETVKRAAVRSWAQAVSTPHVIPSEAIVRVPARPEEGRR